MRDIANGAILWAVAIVGAVAIHRLASTLEQDAVGTAPPHPYVVGSRARRIYATARFIAFARSHGPFKTNQDLARSLRDSSLEGHWCGVDFASDLQHGGTIETRQVFHPGDRDDHFPWVALVLARLAGRPHDSPLPDHRKASILEIDESYMTRNPLEGMQELEELRLAGWFSGSRGWDRRGSPEGDAVGQSLTIGSVETPLDQSVRLDPTLGAEPAVSGGISTRYPSQLRGIPGPTQSAGPNRRVSHAKDSCIGAKGATEEVEAPVTLHLRKRNK